MKRAVLADIWGDTVDLRNLTGGILIGVVLSFCCYLGARTAISSQYPDLSGEPRLGVLFIVWHRRTCVPSAVVSANLFKPKRTLNEEEFSETDRERVLKELQIDLEKEREELKYVDEKVLQEMKDLRLYELFAGTSENAPPARTVKEGDR